MEPEVSRVCRLLLYGDVLSQEVLDARGVFEEPGVVLRQLLPRRKWRVISLLTCWLIVRLMVCSFGMEYSFCDASPETFSSLF